LKLANFWWKIGTGGIHLFLYFFDNHINHQFSRRLWIHQSIVFASAASRTALLRIFEITVPLNVDEVSWLSHGTLFFKFLFEGKLADTFLRHHPGVTNMWLYGSGILLNCGFNQLFPGWLH
jgi:hypothetical protein